MFPGFSNGNILLMVRRNQQKQPASTDAWSSICSLNNALHWQGTNSMSQNLCNLGISYDEHVHDEDILIFGKRQFFAKFHHVSGVFEKVYKCILVSGIRLTITNAATFRFFKTKSPFGQLTGQKLGK